MRKIVLVILPLLAGVGLAAYWQTQALLLPILYLRADASTLSLLLGLIGSVLMAIGLMVWSVAQRGSNAALVRLQQEQTQAHHRFIRRLDHELKNPLTAIRAGLANVEHSNEPALSSVRTQVDRLARLTADLRKLADLETQPVESEPVDLSQVLNEAIELARERRPSATGSINLNLPRVPWPLPPVAGDRDLIFLALHNVMDNACKFCDCDDTIEIRAYEDGHSVAVEVADTGPGVKDDELPHLGEELYRGSTATGVEGSGLGLALVQAIVKRHGGTMTMRSRLGQGTLVTLRFPTIR